MLLFMNPFGPVCRKMDKTKLLALLGLAQKAGKIVSGEFAVEQAVRNKKACLVLVAEDASENSKKSYRDLTGYYGIPCYEVFSKEEIGESIGKAHRAALAVTDQGFSLALAKLLGLGVLAKE